jgi:hypothetical protein
MLSSLVRSTLILIVPAARGVFAMGALSCSRMNEGLEANAEGARCAYAVRGLSVQGVFTVDVLSDFLAWAWARHHNVLSWYIRPLFLIPYIFFAYRRSWKGLVLTVLALASSMFWFPAPATADPAVERFLQAEREYLLGPWTFSKVMFSLTVPAFFGLLAAAFWKRSWWWGVAVINLGALGKIAWSVAEGGSAGWAVLIPAVIGMLVCNAAVYVGVRYTSRKPQQAKS